MFEDLLKTQLVLKNIMTEEDWNGIKDGIIYNFSQDTYYTESKNQEILRSRFEVLQGASSFIGSLFRNILMLTDQQLEEINMQMQVEAPFKTQDQEHQMDMQQQQAELSGEQ